MAKKGFIEDKSFNPTEIIIFENNAENLWLQTMHVGKEVVTLHSQSTGWFVQFSTKGKRGVRPGKNEVCLS